MPRAKKTKAAGELEKKGTKKARSTPDTAGPSEIPAVKEVKGSPVILFAHGAGAGSSSEWMQRWRKLLADTTGAAEVRAFDYPYLAGGKKGAPPKAEKLVPFHKQQMEKLSAEYPSSPVILAGKSMGSRVSCMVAGEEGSPVAAVICLGYPLKGINGAIREDTLLAVKCPIMFVQGTRDSMCPLEHLQKVCKRMSVKTELYVVAGGDHSLTVGVKALKEQGLDQHSVHQKAASEIATFTKSV